MWPVNTVLDRTYINIFIITVSSTGQSQLEFQFANIALFFQWLIHAIRMSCASLSAKPRSDINADTIADSAPSCCFLLLEGILIEISESLHEAWLLS